MQAYWQQRHESKGDSRSAQATIFTQRIAVVQSAFAASCQQVTQQLQADPGHMLLGHTVLAAVHLVSEPASWLCLCLIAWQQLFGARKRQGKKSKGGAGADMASLEGPSEDQLVRSQLAQTQQAVEHSLQGIADAVNVRLKGPTKPQMAHATQTVLGEGPSDLAKALSGCLSQGDIHAVLNSVLVAQNLTLKRVKLQASELVSAL